MAKTMKNDIKIDIIGFFRDLASMVEKEENVTLEPRLLKSLEYIEKEYEIPYNQRNIKKSRKCEKSRRIAESVETAKTIETKTQNIEEVTDKKVEEMEIDK